MSNIENLVALMRKLSDQNALPQNFKSDLDMDERYLTNGPSGRYVWLLRTSGTVIAPVRMGVDPGHITNWFRSGIGQKVIAFTLDTESGLVEKISHEQAEKLIFEPPGNLPVLMGAEQRYDLVTKVLQAGQNAGIWGIFERPNIAVDDWSGWLRFFQESGNTLMEEWMRKAIRLQQAQAA